MSDPTEVRLLSVLENHALTQELRKNDPSVQLERSALAIPPKDQADNFTTGTMGLSIAGGAVAPAVLVSESTATVIAAYHIGRKMTGHVGFCHGGAVATIFDECCGRASLAFFQHENTRKLSNGWNNIVRR